MLQPVGPLPPQVYWRRRLVLLGGIAVVVLLGLAMCSGGAAPNRNSSGAGPSPSATPSTSSAATITASPGTAGGPAQGSAPASGQPTVSPSGGTDTSTGSGTGDSSGGGSPDTGAPPEPCPDTTLTVTASVAKPVYRVGETPVLKLTAQNTGSVSCTRDVGPRQQEMLLYDGSTRLWSSNDCYPDGGTDMRTLSPGESISATVVWSGLSSQPGCAGTRTRVKAGTYKLIARVGGATSQPAKLVLQ